MNPKIKTYVVGLETLDSVIEDMVSLMDQCKIFTFTGPLGAGKTTLVQAFLKRNGILEPVISPTFTYVNVYSNNKNQLFYHFDLYRMHSMQEFLEAGFDEFLYLKDSWALIEWPQIIDPLLRKQVCAVSLDYYGDDNRQRIVELLVI